MGWRFVGLAHGSKARVTGKGIWICGLGDGRKNDKHAFPCVFVAKLSVMEHGVLFLDLRFA